MTNFASLLLAAFVISIVVGVNSSNTENSPLQTLDIVKSACSSTPYPELCYTEIVEKCENKPKLKSPKDVIEASLNITIKVVERNFFRLVNLFKKRGLAKRQKYELRECLEQVLDDTLEDLYEALQELDKYPSKVPLEKQANNLKTLIGNAIKDQRTCIGRLSKHKSDQELKAYLVKDQKHVEKMLYNALAMIKKMTDADIAKEKKLKGKQLN